jgi:hypothetical protein
MVELGMDVGLRPSEIYGLHGHRVDWLRGKIQVIDVMTRLGLREHRSRRGLTASSRCRRTRWRECRS